MTSPLSAGQEQVVARVCELLVPGSSTVRPELYAGQVMAAEEDELHAAIGLMARVTTGSDLARLAGSTAFGLLRRLAIEAYYGDFAPHNRIATGHELIGFAPPTAAGLRKDWSFLGIPAPATSPWDWFDNTDRDDAEVLVVGSGAGGGLIAAELADLGADVLLVEAGGLHPAESHARFELEARHRLWWPTRFASTGDDRLGPIALLAGRCVGGSTVINTKVAMRTPVFEPVDLEPWYDMVETRLGVRERSDWTPSVRQVQQGFTALGATLRPVMSYTDANCSRCGSCLQGCPTNAGKSTLNTFLAPVLANGRLRLRTRCTVEELLLSGRRVSGVRYRHADGATGVLRASVVVLAAGSLNTPQILLRSNDFVALDTPSTRLVGRTLGLHPARLVYGLFDEPQDCHIAYPITAHCLDHQYDSGFVVEATTIQDPVSFAESLVDSDNRPLWGRSLVETVSRYRHWAGLLVMATDENTGRIDLDARDEIVVSKRFSADEKRRLDDALMFAVEVLRAAGAREVVWTGLSTTHMQGSVPMGTDPESSVVDVRGRAHDVDGLYVGDGSLIPESLSVNPSLTIMALAAKVAGHVAAELGS